MWLAAGVEDPFRINICFWATELDVDLSDHSRFLGNHSINDFQRDSLDQWSEQMKLPQCNAIGVRTPPSIWYAFGPYKEVSLIYLFIFSNLSDVLKKKWEVRETCAASRGIFIFQFSSLFHTCYCNAPAIFKYSVPKQQTTTAAILSVISGNESK